MIRRWAQNNILLPTANLFCERNQHSRHIQEGLTGEFDSQVGVAQNQTKQQTPLPTLSGCENSTLPLRSRHTREDLAGEFPQWGCARARPPPPPENKTFMPTLSGRENKTLMPGSLRFTPLDSQAEEHDAWLQHALAHALYFQGRHDEALVFLTERSREWERDKLHPFLFTHLWWHLALLQVCAEMGYHKEGREGSYVRGDGGRWAKCGAAGGRGTSCTRFCLRISGGIWRCSR